MISRFLQYLLVKDAVTVSKANEIDYAIWYLISYHNSFLSGESCSTGAQSASAGLQPTTTVGIGAKAKQGTVCVISMISVVIDKE